MKPECDACGRPTHDDHWYSCPKITIGDLFAKRDELKAAHETCTKLFQELSAVQKACNDQGAVLKKLETELEKMSARFECVR